MVRTAVAGGKGRRGGNLAAALVLAGTVLAAVPPPAAAQGVDVCARTSQVAAAIRSRLGLGGSVCRVTAAQLAGITGRLQVSGPASTVDTVPTPPALVSDYTLSGHRLVVPAGSTRGGSVTIRGAATTGGAP